MNDFINIGPVPCEEECAQVGSPDYSNRAHKELIAFKHQLERMFPDGHFGIKWFPHDFGSYGEVVAYLDDSAEKFLGTDEDGDDDTFRSKESKAAFEAESNMPKFWDDEALEELGLPQNYRE